MTPISERDKRMNTHDAAWMLYDAERMENERLQAEIEALKQQVEQGKRDAVPEGWKLELDSSDIRVIDPNGERWRFRDLDDGGSGQFIFSFLKAMLVAAAPKQEK